MTSFVLINSTNFSLNPIACRYVLISSIKINVYCKKIYVCCNVGVVGNYYAHNYVLTRSIRNNSVNRIGINNYIVHMHGYLN